MADLWVEILMKTSRPGGLVPKSHFNEKLTFRPSVSGHRLLEMTAVILKNEASAIQEYSFA